MVAPELSLAEKRLLLALPKDGTALAAKDVPGFQSEGEVLLAADGMVRQGLTTISETKTVGAAVSDEGRQYQRHGLPERRILRALLTAGGEAPVERLAKEAGIPPALVTATIGHLKKANWANPKRTSEGLALTTSLKEEPKPTSEELLLNQAPAEMSFNEPVGTPAMNTLIERGLVQLTAKTWRTLSLTDSGRMVAKTLKPEDVAGSEVNQLTPELVAAWATMTPQQKAQQRLRPFDFNVDVAVPAPGKAHPLTHIIQEIRDIFVALGFQEIAGDYVEPAFWNMDALFIPQDHPAREMQDTFYVKEPARLPVDGKLFETVKSVQLTGGGTGSTGWGGSFKREESERALLRTHTTVTTIRHLAAHPKGPTRVFGIGRVFRNEAMDATHLPEFHQVEGIVVEDGATLAMLMGILREFYKRMGFPEVKFRPSFYPYTEPSLDVAVKWNGRWLELGGAGIFRPEVTHPLGVKSPVLAWGLGLERLAMLRLGLKDIRQLYLSDVDWLRTSPLR
ncbi:MAG: phenylalanine--tRNA ligase subunit alpha [Candidatus Thermoplasmatota archaeon]